MINIGSVFIGELFIIIGAFSSGQYIGAGIFLFSLCVIFAGFANHVVAEGQDPIARGGFAAAVARGRCAWSGWVCSEKRETPPGKPAASRIPKRKISFCTRLRRCSIWSLVAAGGRAGTARGMKMIW